MDRRKYYLNQLVEDDDLNAGETYTYDAIGNLMSDIGIFGIITGGDVTEQAAPSMSVDMSTPFIGYDQDGARIYKATGDVIDCSQDYLGNPTVPTTPGEKVWISIHGRFAYTEEDPKVIEGDTKYLTWAESYEWRVVAGTPAGGGGHTKPAKPGDAILIADIELDYGHTTILTADIDESRKDTFVFTPATGISVAAGAWTKLDPASADVQDALDSADNELISRESDGDIGQHLLPKDVTVDLGSAGNIWGEGHITNLSIYGSVKASADQKEIGSATERFNAFIYDLLAYNSIVPSADGKALGAVGARFNAYLNAITYYGALAGTHVFSAAKSVTVRVSPDQAMHDGGWTWNAANGWNCAASPQTLYWWIKPPHGAILQSARVRWYQAASTTLVARLASIDEDGAETLLGAGVTIGGAGANRWDTIDTGLAETIDLTTTLYRCKVGTGTAEANRAFVLEITYDVTDILKAALTRG